MGITHSDYIPEKEVLETEQENYEELKQLLMQISSGMTDMMTAGVNEDEIAVRDKLQSIQDLVESVSEEVKEVRVKDMDTEGVDKRLMTILEIFDSLGSDIRFRPPLISIETQTVLAHSCVSWIAEAQSIIEDPEKARPCNGFTFDGEEDRLATVFQARFPKFRGFRILAKRRGMGIGVYLTDGPLELDADEVSPLDALEPHLKKFLNWELRKMPVSMEFKIFKSDGEKKLIILHIKCVDWGCLGHITGE